jgi:hypothetical protein
VSTAGALGWMQFEPETWLQYGVDAINAGFADPYNPEDAIFAAARYLRAAGAETDLSSAIFAYNHSADYVSSVLLRARLITTYPMGVIGTLTGLTEGTPPVAHAHVVAGPKPPAPSGAPAVSPSTSTSPSATAPPATAPPATAPSPLSTAAAPPRFAQLVAAPGARVVAVQDGRVLRVGRSAALGNYLVLRDVYGDEFTYAGLGSLSARYPAPAVHPPRAAATVARAEQEPAQNPKASSASNAQAQAPRTLHVNAGARRRAAGAQAAPPPGQAPTPGKERLFAHPDAAVAAAAEQGTSTAAPAAVTRHGVRYLPLIRGALLKAGTVIGHLPTPDGVKTARIRFAVKPSGDTHTVDALPVLTNWNLLQAALHPKGGNANAGLLGATAGDAFLLTTSQLQQAVLTDPGISIYACGRQDIASGVINSRVLALLAFLSRSGLKPTVSSLRCGNSEVTTTGKQSANARGDGVDISAINGIPIEGHQGANSITDTTIRTMLTLQGQFEPHQINSLMSYPGTGNTLALPDHADHLQVTFSPASTSAAPGTAAPGHGRAAAAVAPPPDSLDPDQWDQLMTTLAAIPSPTVATKPSSAAIRDPQAAPGNQTLGTLPAGSASSATPVQ